MTHKISIYGTSNVVKTNLSILKYHTLPISYTFANITIGFVFSCQIMLYMSSMFHSSGPVHRKYDFNLMKHDKCQGYE